MTKKLVIFGAGDIAQLAHYYFTHDSEYEVAGFTVDSDFLTDEKFCDLPNVPFENLQKHYPPNKFDLFIALSYSKLNELRKQRYLTARDNGYTLASYISSKATVLNDGRFGDNCFVLEDNTIQPFVSIGNNVTLWSGNHIGHHSTIGDHCFLASQIVVSGGVRIGCQCFIGVNATLRDHITVSDKTVIGAGALIMESTEDESVYIGPSTKKSRLPSSKLRKM